MSSYYERACLYYFSKVLLKTTLSGIFRSISSKYIIRRVSGATWSVDNRLHGQRSGAFWWRPVLRHSQEDRPIPSRRYPELRTWMAVLSGVISASPRTREMFRHLSTCDQAPWLCPGCIPSTTSLTATTQHTMTMSNYTHAPTVTNSTAFHL